MRKLSILMIMVILVLSCFVGVSLPVKKENVKLSKTPQVEQDNTSSLNRVEYTLNKDNWFDFVNEFWPRYTTAEVIDMQTLTRYKVMRVGGYNHADVEPIDQQNTNKMYSIYDYQWSWTRRPVWVYVNNRYIAASINGYPHAYDMVQDNNMTGHTCMHFYKSRTHASNNWDPAHREAVETAYNNLTKFINYTTTYHSK